MKKKNSNGWGFRLINGIILAMISPVSYTHLDVYKRQVYFKPGKCLHDILTKQDFRHGSKASVPPFIKMFQSEPGHLCVNIFVFKCPV